MRLSSKPRQDALRLDDLLQLGERLRNRNENHLTVSPSDGVQEAESIKETLTFEAGTNTILVLVTGSRKQLTIDQMLRD